MPQKDAFTVVLADEFTKHQITYFGTEFCYTLVSYVDHIGCKWFDRRNRGSAVHWFFSWNCFSIILTADKLSKIEENFFFTVILQTWFHFDQRYNNEDTAAFCFLECELKRLFIAMGKMKFQCFGCPEMISFDNLLSKFRSRSACIYGTKNFDCAININILIMMELQSTTCLITEVKRRQNSKTFQGHENDFSANGIHKRGKCLRTSSL